MKYRIPIIALVLSAIALAVSHVAGLWGSSRQEPAYQERIRKEASGEAESTVSTPVAAGHSSSRNQAPAVPPEDRSASRADEAATRKLVKDEATKDARIAYSLLLEHLGLTSETKDALMSSLIEYRISWTSVPPYFDGHGWTEAERAKRIEAIIGQPGLQEFLRLEQNLGSYAEVHKVGSALERKGVPLADSQRDRLLKVLVATKEDLKSAPRPDAKPGSMQLLEQEIGQIDEYERRVLELAPSVLSSKQVRYLFELYQRRWNARANALEMQKKRRAANPGDNTPLWYPGF